MGRVKRTPATEPSSTASNAGSENSAPTSTVDMLAQNFAQMSQVLTALTQNVTALNSVAGRSQSTNRLIPHVQPHVPTYDPSEELSSVERYITQLEQLAEANQWDETVLIVMATSHLRGMAEKWYKTQPNLNLSWEEWKAKLRESFSEEINYEAVLEKLVKRVKRPDEDLLTYYYDKLTLLQPFKFDDKIAVNLLVGGLKTEREVWASAKASNHSTPSSLLQLLKSYGSNSLHVKASSSKRIEFRSRNKPYAHRESQKRCFSCGKVGHISRDCFRKKEHPVGQPSKEVMTTKNDKVPLNNKYFMNAEMNGHGVRVFVDFGSSAMLIKKKTADTLQLKYDNKKTYLKGYGGGVVESIGTTGDVAIKLDECEVILPLLVVPDDKQEVDAIIGQPFTEHKGVTVYKTDRKLRFIKNVPGKDYILQAKMDTLVPSNYVGYVDCTGNLTGEIYLDESIRLREGEEYAIPRCILKIEEDKTCKLPVTNLSSTDLLIKKDQILARGQGCQKEQDHMLAEPKKKMTPLNSNDVDINKNLSQEQKKQLMQLINSYRDCFAMSLCEMGCAENAKMEICLTSSKPVTYRPYRMAHSERELVKGMIDQLKEADVIQDSFSEYASPIILVNKPNGQKRLCIDYRKLNQITHKERHPLPHMEDQIDQLKNYKYFTTLDLFSGYYQVKMGENSIPKTAFVTNDGHYEFKRMPFGLANAPSVFQRIINNIFGPLGGTVALAYLDDILSPCQTFEEGLEKLTKIFETLRKNHLTLNPSKCHFFQEKINYLGLEVSRDGVRPGLGKAKAIEEFQRPKNIHNVRQFLGLTGFFRRFIPNHAKLTAPLTKLLRKKEEWKWTDEQENSFIELKNKLKERPLLAIYDHKLPVEIHTDASQCGIAGIMLQPNEDEKLKPTHYFSRQLTTAESKWHSYELETLAVLETLRRFRVYLIGKPFKVLTDCQALKMASQKRDLVPRIARWWLQLQEFDFIVEHRAGSKMSHVDALSRNPATEDALETENFVLRIEPYDWVLVAQLTDDKINAIKHILEKPATDEYAKQIHKDYKLKENRLYKVDAGKELWVVPKGLRREILRACHDEMGHFSTNKTLDKLKEAYWFPRMTEYTTNYIKACIPCAQHKEPTGRKEGYLHPIEKVEIPFHTLHADHLGPFNQSTGGKKYVFAVIDSFTKFILLHAVKNTTTAAVLRFLKTTFTTYGIPTRLITDRGSAFTSKGFKDFTKLKGIKHILNAVATPRANGQIERYNATILQALATSIKHDDEWEKRLPDIQFAMNNTKNASTSLTPSELLMGYRPRASADSALTIKIQPERPVIKDLNKVRVDVKRRMTNDQRKQKERFDLKRLRPRRYNVGDLVMVRKRPTADGGSRKLLPRYKGPLQVEKILPNDRYLVSEIRGSTRSSRAPFRNVESVEHLKKWVNKENLSDED